MIAVGRPVWNITDLETFEYLCGDESKLMTFASVEMAVRFLKKSGCSDEQILSFSFIGIDGDEDGKNL